jgi:hypothetical protein
LVTQGCEGAIKLLGPSPEQPEPSAVTGGGTGQVGAGGGSGFEVEGPPRPDDPNLPGDPNLPEDAPREMPSPSSRAARLSKAEYENTARDLLGVQMSLGITNAFVADSSSTTFNNNGGDLVVTSAEWQDFQTAAETLAERATASTAALTAVAGGAIPADDEGLIRALGRRAFRRPLTSAEVSAYTALIPMAATYYAGLPAKQALARIVLEAMLQSPHFLYRVELSTNVSSEVILLSGPELANRLSYALWQSMPDEELLRAAEDQTIQTEEGYTAQATRMLADPKAKASVGAFHSQLLNTARYADLTRSTTLFPEWSQALNASMKQEQERFIEAQVFTEQQGLKGLLSSPTTYVDANLARVYGLTGNFDSSFQKITFNDGKRGGLLTQIGFLTANATSTETDPIHRGVFINHQILCAPLPSPPNNVPPLPASDPSVPKTMRQRITEFTGTGTCGAGCHSTMINPVGFAYEHYDALGRWRDTDKGLPVDSADRYFFEGVRREFDGSAGLAQAMVEEPMAHRCYAQHWVEFLHGRAVGDADKAMIARVGKLSWQDQIPVTQVLRLLVESESFKTRSTEER